MVAEIDKEVAPQFPKVTELTTEVSPHLPEVAVSATKVAQSTTEVASHLVSHISKVAELGIEVAPNLPEVAPDLPKVALDLLEVVELAKVAEDVSKGARVAGTIASQSFFDSFSDTALEEAMQNAINVVKIIKTTKESTPHCTAIVPNVGRGGSNLGYVTPILPRRTIKLPFFLQSPFVQNFDSTSSQSGEATSGGEIKTIKGFCPLDDKIGEFPDYELSQDFKK